MKNINVAQQCHSLHHVNQSCVPGYLCAHAHTTLRWYSLDRFPVLLPSCSFFCLTKSLMLLAHSRWPEFFSSWNEFISEVMGRASAFDNQSTSAHLVICSAFYLSGSSGGGTYEQIHGSPLDGPPARRRTLSEHLRIFTLLKGTTAVLWRWFGTYLFTLLIYLMYLFILDVPIHLSWIIINIYIFDIFSILISFSFFSLRVCAAGALLVPRCGTNKEIWIWIWMCF